MDLRTGRCHACGHGEIIETTPRVTVDGQRGSLEVIGGEALELWTCAQCGLSQLTVRDPAAVVKSARSLARRVRAEPPEGDYDLSITRDLPTDGVARVALESKLAWFLRIEPQLAARMLDGPIPIALMRGVPWHRAEHGRALLARANIEAEILQSQCIGYRG